MGIYSMLAIVAGTIGIIDITRHITQHLSVREQCKASVKIYEAQVNSAEIVFDRGVDVDEFLQ